MKHAFTMIELIFVIVVIGILAAIAIPKFAVTRDDANIVKGKSNVASIQSALVTQRTSNIMRGEPRYPEQLDDADENEVGEPLFGNILDRPITSSDSSGGWMKIDDNEYEFHISASKSATFSYDGDDNSSTYGHFSCDSSDNCHYFE